MAVIGVALEGFGGEEQAFAIGRGDADLAAELVGFVRLDELVACGGFYARFAVLQFNTN